MKNIHLNSFKTIALLLCFGLINITFAQNINFTFDNAKITSDGTNHYYEADILISSDSDFKLGDGQLYFDYNTEAFGENSIENISISYPDDSYICKQSYSGANIYGSFILNNNTSSRLSVAFSQTLGASTIQNANITNVPKKLFHIKIQYLDGMEDEEPMVCFAEKASAIEDLTNQFYTACGTGDGITKDCFSTPGQQIKNDTFDCSKSAISNDIIEESIIERPFRLFPNPAKATCMVDGVSENSEMIIIDGNGRIVMKQKVKNNTPINIEKLPTGFFIVNITTDNGVIVKKLIKE